MPSGAVFHEYTISHPNLLGIGYVSGPVDYLVASTVGNMRPNETGGVALPGSRRFLVVEAKQGATMTLAVSLSQLLAQILTVQHDDPCNPFLIDVLTISERNEHAGVLTDGSHWRFFLFSKKDKEILLHSSGNIVAGDRISCNKVLGNSPHISKILTCLKVFWPTLSEERFQLVIKISESTLAKLFKSPPREPSQIKHNVICILDNVISR